MRFRIISLVSLAFLAASFVGCGGPKLPEGFPEVYPCSVKVIQDGAPLADANVTLFTDDQQLMRWPIGGTTDANGIAKLNTYSYPGAPAGKFRVAISKIDVPNRATSYEEAQKNMQEGVEEEAFDTVDPKFGDNLQTPFALEIQASKDNPVQEFDVGEAVHISREGLLK